MRPLYRQWLQVITIYVLEKERQQVIKMESLVLKLRPASQDLIVNLTTVSNRTPGMWPLTNQPGIFWSALGGNLLIDPFHFPWGSLPKTMHSLLIISIFFSPFLPLKTYISCSSVAELNSLLLLCGLLPDSQLFNKHNLITKIYSIEFLLFNIWL